MRMPALHFVLWICFIARGFSAPHVPSIIRREVVDTNPAPPIHAMILDHTGRDITSSFQIMLYHPQATLITNDSLSPRQASLSRLLNDCPTGTFHESFCTPEHNKAGSLQSYRIICNVVVPVAMTNAVTTSALLSGFIPDQTVRSHARDGHCADHEICVPGPEPTRAKPSRRIAKCVSTQSFVNLINWANNNNDQQLLQPGLNFEGMSVSTVLSLQDETTPTEVDAFQIEAQSIAGAPHVQKKSCRDCMELTSDQLGSGTGGLKVKATLLTTGGMAGLLWLAVLSG